jgi:hypothetical protein
MFAPRRHDDRDGQTKDHAEMTSTDNDVGYIEATLIRSDDPLTKTYAAVASDGMPRVIGSPFLTHGTATRVQIPIGGFAREFAGLLEDLHQNTCVTLGSLVNGVVGDTAKIVTRDRYQAGSGDDGTPTFGAGRNGSATRRGNQRSWDWITTGRTSPMQFGNECRERVVSSQFSSRPSPGPGPSRRRRRKR